MSDSDSMITLTENGYSYLMYVLFFVGLLFVMFGVATLLWPDPYGLFFILSAIPGAVFLVMLVFLFFIITRSIDSVDAVSNQQYPENLDYLNLDHDAFIVIHSMGIHGIGQYTGIDNLINHFLANEIPFKIYHCFNPDDVTLALKNEHAKYVWIFAHGWRGGVAFKWGGRNNPIAIIWPKSTTLSYASLANMNPPLPKKRFIAQLHCNPLHTTRPNIPLPQILMQNLTEYEYYVTDNSLNHYAVWFATRELVSKIQRPSTKQEK